MFYNPAYNQDYNGPEYNQDYDGQDYNPDLILLLESPCSLVRPLVTKFAAS